MCDVCGVNWRRSQLRLREDGTLTCPDDTPGRDIVELQRGNAAASRRHMGPSVRVDRGGGYSTPGDTATNRTTAEDI